MKTTNRTRLFKIILTSLLIAINVIMERFIAVNVWNQSISFSFITIAFAAVFIGIPSAIAVGAFGDIIGAILFPFGTYFVGFTITNILAAFITAVFIYKNATVIKIIASVVINKITTTLLLNTLWITILYRDSLDAFPLVLVSRIPQALLLGAVEIVVLILIFSKKSRIKISIEKLFKKMLDKAE